MTISSSLNAGVAGLNSNAVKLAAISDNIANASTFGYKRVEADFQSMVTGSVGGTYTAGGVRSSTQRMVSQSGSLVNTSNPTDLAVRGGGMLPVARETEVEGGSSRPQMLLTTTASFRQDANGYLKSDSGLILMGWPANADGEVPDFPRDSNAGLQPVRVDLSEMSGQPTTQINLGVNLPATDTQAGASGDPRLLTVEYFDNLGMSESVQVEYTPVVPASGSSNQWTMTLTDSAQGNAVIGEYLLEFDDSRSTGGTLLSVSAVSGGAYDPVEGSVIVNVGGGPMEVDIGMLGEPGGLSQLSDTFAPLAVTKDGSPVSSVVSVQIDENGFVQASFDSGVTRVIYQIPLAHVPNPNGLLTQNRQTYMPSPESGAFVLWDAGTGPTGEIVAFAREESTTDVAGELTDMIQTQRAYSSNAKVIQTVDEMLQETTNIKR